MIADAESILRVCGLGSYLHIGCGKQTLVFELLKRSADAYGLDSASDVIAENEAKAPGRFFQGELAQYPFEAESFDHIIIGDELLHYQVEQLTILMSAVRLMARKTIIINFSPQAHEKIKTLPNMAERRFWENALSKAGIRKNARAMACLPMAAFSNTQMQPLSFYERAPESTMEQYQQDIIQTGKGAYADLLRASNVAVDNTISRYNLLRYKIRPNDVVVDLGCKTGAGAAILAASGQAKQVIGIDADSDIIAYAESNYAHPTLKFQCAELSKLNMIADHSIDVVIAVDAFDKSNSKATLLAEIKRILKPDGRLLGSMSGNFKDIQNLLFADFILEARWAASNEAQYQVAQINEVVNYQPASWVFSSFVNPTLLASVPYTSHFSSTATLPKHVDFGQYYDNPWLYRVMVQLGERISDKDVLAKFCLQVANSAKKGSADQGAALCVIAYQMLELGNTELDSLMHLIKHINEFDAAFDKNNIHAHRWSISLHYVGARLLLTVGNREEALAAFNACAEMDVMQLSPLLATKTISSHMYAGMLYASIPDLDQAKHHFKMAVKEAHRVLQNDWADIVGDLNNPLAFGLPETAEVLDIASQCAAALQALEMHAELPGQLWEKINIKRFGLVEWNHSLERENRQLRSQTVLA